MNEWLRAMQYVRQTLLADPGKPPQVGTKVYRGKALQGTPTPYLVVNYVNTHDISVVNGIRIWAEIDLDVKVVDKPEMILTMQTITDWLDRVLHRSSGSVTDAEIMSCLRLNSFDYDDDKQFEHMGFSYRIQVRAL